MHKLWDKYFAKMLQIGWFIKGMFDVFIFFMNIILVK